MAPSRASNFKKYVPVDGGCLRPQTWSQPPKAADPNARTQILARRLAPSLVARSVLYGLLHMLISKNLRYSRFTSKELRKMFAAANAACWEIERNMVGVIFEANREGWKGV